MENKQEYILCAAIWLDNDKQYRMQPTNIASGIVIYGHRHPHCKIILMSWFYPDWQNNSLQEQLKIEINNKEVQGFLTNRNRFVGRQEAWIIAEGAGQIKQQSGGRGTLYSEDLY